MCSSVKSHLPVSDPWTSYRRAASGCRRSRRSSAPHVQGSRLRHSYPCPCPRQFAEHVRGIKGYSRKFVELVLAGEWVCLLVIGQERDKILAVGLLHVLLQGQKIAHQKNRHLRNHRGFSAACSNGLSVAFSNRCSLLRGSGP